MKIDIKSILIIVFLLLSLLFGYKWFFGGNNIYKEKVKDLQTQFDSLNNQKIIIDNEIKTWKMKFDSIQLKEAKLKLEIDRLELEIKKAEDSANKSKESLDKLRNELKETKDKIILLKENPTNRTGDFLIESLKNKTK